MYENGRLAIYGVNFFHAANETILISGEKQRALLIEKDGMASASRQYCSPSWHSIDAMPYQRPFF